jgi:putative transcriptional regulator
MDSLHGFFLVASLHQLDPNFAKAVILVFGHNESGAFGVIVNDFQRKNQGLQLPFDRMSRSQNASIHWGGPVKGPLMAVHARGFFGEWELLPGVFMSRRKQNVFALVQRHVQPCKIFKGYVGWGPGQLENEVEQEIWHVVPAAPQLIFHETGNLWERLSRLVSRLMFLAMFNIQYAPGDPLLN